MIHEVSGHFDGKHVVLDEPLDAPAGTAVIVRLAQSTGEAGSGLQTAPTREERRAALMRLANRAVSGLRISDESLRREAIYADRGR